MSSGHTHQISSQKLTLADLHRMVFGQVRLGLSAEATSRITRCREFLDKKIQNARDPIYGINTGFGSLYNRHISTDQLEKLQENLVKSHACGTGPEVPDEIIRLMLFLKVRSEERRVGKECRSWRGTDQREKKK